MKFRKTTRRLAIVVTATTMIVTSLLTSPAQAISTYSVSPSNPVTSAASDFTFTIASPSATAAKCIRLAFATTVDATTGAGSGTAGITARDSGGTSALSGTAFTAASWTIGTYAATGQIDLTYATGQALTAGTITITNLLNTATVGSYYAGLTTFSDSCGGTKIEQIKPQFALNPSTQVTVNVDAAFTFTVNATGAASTCNGTGSATNASTSSAVSLGTVTTAANRFGNQGITVASNAANGWTLYLKSSAASTPVMKGLGSASNTITDASAGVVPAAGTSFFGYTSDLPGGTTSGNIAAVPLTYTAVGTQGAGGTGVTGKCIGYAVGISTLTAADSYATNIVYQAVPSY